MKSNQTLPDLFISVGFTSQLYRITRQKTSLSKQSKTNHTITLQTTNEGKLCDNKTQTEVRYLQNRSNRDLMDQTNQI
jgi:hypothetical protein